VKLQTGAGGEFSLYTGGRPQPDLMSGLMNTPSFERVMFASSPDGLQADPVSFLIDEVVVSSSPVGCTD
jgi:hypothetical protein